MKKIFIVFTVVALAYISVMYFVNPFDIKSLHPRARLWGIDIYRIPSGAMSPNLNAGDVVLVTTMSKKVERGDVVVFRFPPNPEISFVKRLIGKGGDKIVYRGKRLFINGEAAGYSNVVEYDEHREQVNESIDEASWNIILDKTMGTKDVSITVPKGQLFFLGDNRDNSNDSRYWGFVDESEVMGVVLYVF